MTAKVLICGVPYDIDYEWQGGGVRIHVREHGSIVPERSMWLSHDTLTAMLAPTEKEALTVEQARLAFDHDKIENACFSMNRNWSATDQTRLNLYRYRTPPGRKKEQARGDAFLWLVWDGPLDYDDISGSIKAGGRLAGRLEDCAREAVGELFAYLATREP